MYYFIFVYLIQLTALKMFEMPLFDCLHVLLPYTSTELHFCKLISYFLPHSIYLITLVSFFAGMCKEALHKLHLHLDKKNHQF